MKSGNSHFFSAIVHRKLNITDASAEQQSMILAPLELHDRYRKSAEKDLSDKKFKEGDRSVSCRSTHLFFSAYLR